MQLKKWVKLQIIVWNVKMSWSILELLSRIIKRHAAYCGEGLWRDVCGLIGSSRAGGRVQYSTWQCKFDYIRKISENNIVLRKLLFPWLRAMVAGYARYDCWKVICFRPAFAKSWWCSLKAKHLRIKSYIIHAFTWADWDPWVQGPCSTLAARLCGGQCEGHTSLDVGFLGLGLTRSHQRCHREKILMATLGDDEIGDILGTLYMVTWWRPWGRWWVLMASWFTVRLSNFVGLNPWKWSQRSGMVGWICHQRKSARKASPNTAVLAPAANPWIHQCQRPVTLWSYKPRYFPRSNNLTASLCNASRFPAPWPAECVFGYSVPMAMPGYWHLTWRITFAIDLLAGASTRYIFWGTCSQTFLDRPEIKDMAAIIDEAQNGGSQQTLMGNGKLALTDSSQVKLYMFVGICGVYSTEYNDIHTIFEWMLLYTYLVCFLLIHKTYGRELMRTLQCACAAIIWIQCDPSIASRKNLSYSEMIVSKHTPPQRKSYMTSN